MSTEVEWKVLNPTAEYETILYAGAPRVVTLANKKVGLLWNGKAGADILLDKLGERLQGQHEDIELIKFDLTVSIGAENIKQIGERCDAVIGAVGD